MFMKNFVHIRSLSIKMPKMSFIPTTFKINKKSEYLKTAEQWFTYKLWFIYKIYKCKTLRIKDKGIVKSIVLTCSKHQSIFVFTEKKKYPDSRDPEK